MLIKHDSFLRRWRSSFFSALQQQRQYGAIANDVLNRFCRSIASGVRPTEYVLCTVINSCKKAQNLSLGLQIHAYSIHGGYKECLILNTALVDLYFKCSEVIYARKVFDHMPVHDGVSWTSIISGFSQNKCGNDAILMFKQMFYSPLRPNCVTYVSTISGCKWIKDAFIHCLLLHGHIFKLGFEANTLVLGSLMDCYSKHGRVDYAAWVFDDSREKDDVLFSSMICGFSQNALNEKALRLFIEMRRHTSCLADQTLTNILSACTSMVVLHQGKQVHALIIKLGSEKNIFISSSLIDMYCKCGAINEALNVFEQSSLRNEVLWTSMITGLAQSGFGEIAMDFFEKFLAGGFVPDDICFTAILTACNHAGLVEKGLKYFNKMKSYGLVPQFHHHACLIDLFARHGYLHRARELMEEMPIRPGPLMWASFLSSCRVHGDIGLAREAAENLFKLEPHSAFPYLALASIYQNADLWEDTAEIKKLMVKRRIKNRAGWSLIETDKTSTFNLHNH